MKLAPYKSCNCRQCKLTSAAVKREHKRRAHRKLRHQARRALRAGRDEAMPARVSSGYKA